MRVQNIGITDAVFVNMPTVPYNHANPDKFRVPFDKVPTASTSGIGW
jgi:dTDP-4-dehydrorhamnose 3,5-epimerase